MGRRKVTPKPAVADATTTRMTRGAAASGATRQVAKNPVVKTRSDHSGCRSAAEISSTADDQDGVSAPPSNSQATLRKTSPKNIKSTLPSSTLRSLRTRPQTSTTSTSASTSVLAIVAAIKKRKSTAKGRTLTNNLTVVRAKSDSNGSMSLSKRKTNPNMAAARQKLKGSLNVFRNTATAGKRSRPIFGSKTDVPPLGNKRKRDVEEDKSPPPEAARSPKKLKKPRKNDLSPKPHVTEYLVDPTFQQDLPIPFISAAFQSKLLIRAVMLNDMKMLQKLVQDKKSISSLCMPRSVQILRDALSYAIETGNLPAIKILLPKSRPEGLAPNPEWLLQEDNTGRGSRFQFGHALRNVTVGRGGKEGNAALLKDRYIFNAGAARETYTGTHIIEAVEFGLPYSTQEKIKGLHKEAGNDDYTQLNQIFAAVRRGHNELAAQMIGDALTKGGFGFNNLHQEALIKSKKSPLTPFKSQSVGKMSTGNSRITPVHCAAVNPDPFILSTLLSSSPLYTVLDSNHWSVVHYAAACTGTLPLEWLIAKGVATNQASRDGCTPAHIAAENGRWKNLEIILNTEAKSKVAAQEAGEVEDGPKEKIAADAFSATRVNKKGFAPLHIACEHGKLEVVKVLVSCPLVDVNKPTPAQSDKLTPLMIATGHGHLEIVKYLIGFGAKLQVRDRRGNTALTHAVINGHAHIVSYLLRIGDNHLVKDSSGNSLIHYACAYGWYFNLMLLMEAGCCPNETNLWKLTPLAIAFCKGQIGLVEILLKQPGVNINAPIDGKGLTLLLQTASSQPSADVVSRLKYLIEKQKADCAVADFEQNNAIHYVVKSEAEELNRIKEQKERGWEVEERKGDHTLQALKLLVKHGAKLNAGNLSQETPIFLAVRRGCFQLAQQLVELGGALTPDPDDSGNTLLHLLVEHLTEDDPSIEAFYQNSAKNPEALAAMKSMCKIYNKLGMNVLLSTLNQYPTLDTPEKTKRVVEFILFLIIQLDSDVNSALTEKIGGVATNGNSALHLAAGLNYSEEVLKIILTKKPNMDPLNGDFRTPLCLSILKRTHTATRILIENGANVNFISEKDGEKSMILLEASKTPNTFELIPLFVEKGAVVKEIVDKHTGNSVLHFISRNPTASFAVEAIRAVIRGGAVINCENKYFRTSLHLAVNSREGDADDSYEVEDVLIEAGSSLNLKDVNGRTPLHFAFLKMGEDNKETEGNSFMDPIELVTLLTSAMKERKCKIDIEASDEFGQTPLHLAAVRGATISASHLLAESNNPKSLLNRPDKKGNTPFALAVLNNHEGSALMLLQNGADFVIDLTTGFSKALRDETVAKSWIWKPVKQEGERLDRENATLCKYSILQEIVRRDWQGLLYLMLEKLKATGSGVTPGIEAALKTRRLKLAAKLIDRVKIDEQLITKKQSLLHTLATNGPSDQEETWAIQSRILQTLVRKKADVNALDSQKSTPLIYAAIEWNSHLCSEFTALMNIRQIPHLKPDFVGRTPFTALFWKPIETNREFPQSLKAWTESLLFSGGEGNVLCQYPIMIPKFPGIRYISQESSDPNYFITSITSQYSPLIMAVIYGNKKVVKWLLGLQGKININFPDSGGRTPLMHAVRLNDIQMVKLLLNPAGYDFEKDNTPWDDGTSKARAGAAGKTTKVTKKGSSYTNCVTSGIDLNVVDKEGWSVIHHLVAPVNSSSPIVYARSDAILRVLASAGARLDIRTSESPLEMAVRQRKFPLAKSLATLMGSASVSAIEKRIREEREYGALPSINDGIGTVPVEEAQKDAKEMLLRLKSKLAIPEEDELVEPDSLTDFTLENSIVLVDEARKVPFDCLLNQVDLSYGIFGLYNFYKMQLIKQTKGPELVVLFTRWGRMGDTGQYQKTPFPTEAEAIDEFKKIFKAKTGNIWDDGATGFVPHPKKYKLVSLDRGIFSKVNPKFSETVKVNFVELERAGEAQNTELSVEVFELLKKLSLEHRSRGVDPDSLTEMLPFGQIDYETLLKAEKILDQIDKLLKEESARKDKSSGVTAPLGESVLKLSEEYFTLIPLHGYAFEKIRPFAQVQELRKHQELIRNFLHNEFAFQLLLAAQWNQGMRNPFEFIYAALGTKLQVLDESSEESQLILEYIYNTSTHPERPIVEKIYRVQIPGAEESLNETGLGNRHLLWHGTRTCNLLSILNRGLQITPLGYTFNGSLFGKGIYFADMFEKCMKYTATAEHGESRFALLCEVALGQVQDVETGYWVSQDQEILKAGKNCLKTSNSRWMPEPSADVFWNGRRIPLGQKSENILPENDEGYGHGLDYNEYIIFKPEQANIKYLVQFKGSFPDIKMKNLFR